MLRSNLEEEGFILSHSTKGTVSYWKEGGMVARIRGQCVTVGEGMVPHSTKRTQHYGGGRHGGVNLKQVAIHCASTARKWKNEGW